MKRRIVYENPKYPPVKLIEPTTLGYVHLAEVVQLGHLLGSQRMEKVCGRL